MAPDNGFYNILGVSPTATPEEIKKAYRTASLAHHPDKQGGSKEKMQDINHAYDILSDPRKRQNYDNTGLNPTLHPSAGASEFKSGGYCAGCDDDPCRCFVFKPAGSSKPSNAPKCFECHRDVKDILHVELSCGCCFVCQGCANRLFRAPPHVPRRKPHVKIDFTFKEVKDILSPEIWQACNLARQPICYFCKTPNATFVTGLCKVHNWCRTCFINIYSVTTRNPRCCDKMVNHLTLRQHLPEPVLALYEMRQAAGFEPWRQKDQQGKLLRELKDWQHKNRDLVFSDAAREALGQKDTRIKDLEDQLKDLEAQLKACNEARSQKAAKEVSTAAGSELKDELVRKNMRIKALEQSNKVLTNANTIEKVKFAEAGKARKIAVDNEAVFKKENEDLVAQLAAARSSAGKHHRSPSANRHRGNSRGRNRNDNPAGLAASQGAQKTASNTNDACQKRVKDLEAEVSKLRQEFEEQQQATAYSQKQTRIQLTSSKAAEKVAIHNNDVTQQRIKDLEGKISQLQLELRNQAKALKDRQSEMHGEIVAAQVAEKTAVEKESKARKQLEELEAQLANTDTKETASKTSDHTLQDRITSLEKQLAAAKQSTRCQHCEISGASSDEAKPLQNPEPSSSPPSSAKPSQDKKSDKHSTTTPSVDKGTDKPETVHFGLVDSQPIPIPDPDITPKTPMSLLKSKLHYARSLQTAAENNAMLALDEVLDLKAQLRKHQKFEAEVKKEFAKANKMYSSLQHKFNRAMTQLQPFQKQTPGAIKIPADQFAHDINDHSKSASEILLLKLKEQLEPVKTQIRKSQAKKSKKAPEPPLKVAARRNRRLRNIIKEREQEMADVRIEYGNKWTKVIAGIVDRDSEIRQLRRKLNIRESRHNSDASVGAAT